MNPLPGTQPTLRQLELFVAATQHGSFAAAADAMYVTPNAVSSAVTELETVFNTQLFIRRRAKGLTTTTTGRDLVEHARQLLQQAHELTLAIGNRDDVPRGSVKVGCYATLAATIIPELWSQTAQRLPLVQLDIEEGAVEDLSKKLLHGHLDMMISYQVGLPAGVLCKLSGFSPCITAGKPPVSYPGIRVVAFAGTRSPHFARPATGWRQHPAVDARTRSAPQCHSPVNKLRDRSIHGGTRIRLLIIFSRNTHRTVLRRPAGRGPSN